MANLQFFGGTETTSEAFLDALQARAQTVSYLGGDQAGEIKKAFDALKVNIIGKPMRPRNDISSLIEWSRRNELAYACIEKISQAAIDPEPIIERKSGNKWATVDGHDMRALLMKPNALDDNASFLGAWLASKHIAGRFFAEIVRDKPTGRPIALWPLHPGKVFPIPGKGKDGSNIVGWKFKDSHIEIDFRPDEILYDRNRDLTSHFDALPPLAVALGAIDMDSAQTDYIRAFFNNGGVPSGILRFNKRTLNKQEAEQKRQAWALRYGRGGIGERGIAVLDEGAEYQKIGTDIKELEADSLRGQAEARICMVFGVPPLLIGAYVGLKNVNQRASAREAQKDFWDNKMSPTFKALRSFLTWNLLGAFENPELIRREQVRVNWDMSQVLALQEEADKRHARAREDFRAGGITQNEYREEIGRDLTPDGDFFLIPSSVNPRTGEVLLSIAQREPAPPPAPGDPAQLPPAEEETGDELEKLRALFLESKARWAIPAEKVFRLGELPLAREPKEWESHLDLKAIAEAPGKFSAKIKAVLMGLRKNLIRQATEALAERDPAELHSVVLTPTPATYKKIRRELDSAYKLGRALVDAEAGRARPKQTFIPKDFKADEDWLEDEDGDYLDEIAGTTVSRIVNDIQSRAAGILATLALLAVQGTERRSRIKQTLDDSSTAYIEQAAGAVANAAINSGRDAEIESRSDEISRVLYSAILDVNTCESCELADGMEAQNVDDLPPAPNDECLGGDKCRCFHVAVFADEETDAGE